MKPVKEKEEAVKPAKEKVKKAEEEAEEEDAVMLQLVELEDLE